MKNVVVTDGEPFVLAAFVAARRWVPPAEEWTRGLPGEVVTVSDCLAGFEPHDTEPWIAPWLPSLEAAQQAVDAAQAVPAVRDMSVFALAMSVPGSIVDDLVEILDDDPGPIVPNLGRRVVVPPVDVVGFEVVGFDLGRFHSWHCYDLRAGLDVRLNEFGQLDTLAAAQQIAARSNRDRGTPGGTPLDVTWFPIRITQHSTASPLTRRGQTPAF